MGIRMTEQLQEIGKRLAALRTIQEMSREDLAAQTGVTVQQIEDYEAGRSDFSFSFLSTAASLLHVDVVELLSGDSPKLSSCCIVRRGQGLSIDRRRAYSYKHLAYTFTKKMADPFFVKVEPKDQPPEKKHHLGQEFDYMLSGRMRLFVGQEQYDLEAGDSAYYDSSQPHAMMALDNASAEFLAIVIKGDATHAVV